MSLPHRLEPRSFPSRFDSPSYAQAPARSCGGSLPAPGETIIEWRARQVDGQAEVEVWELRHDSELRLGILTVPAELWADWSRRIASTAAWSTLWDRIVP